LPSLFSPFIRCRRTSARAVEEFLTGIDWDRCDEQECALIAERNEDFTEVATPGLSKSKNSSTAGRKRAFGR